ncbi:unnamed protein product [Cuscuta europaea]|uniref:Retrovirus-related Pol polyprotein from transposon TNT 1-94 n=1 Tax=Cuscuta europaea TaxID=41803 RepID=A0A9P0ZHL6_CUSEU|nr:unnamed protein product [Cuscuta europaea]
MKKSMSIKISLLYRLFTFKMNISVSLSENLDNFLKLTQEIEKVDEKIKDTHQAVILLNSLPPQFDNFKDVIQYSNDDLTPGKITDAIHEKNESLKVFKSKSDPSNTEKTKPKNEALVIKGKPKNKKNSSKKKNKTDKDNSEKKTSKCHYCGIEGHFARDCRKKKRDKQGDNKNNPNPTSNTESANIFQHELLVCSGSSLNNEWILDSGCTLHTTPNKTYFSSLTLYDGGKVMSGDNTALDIKGVGNVPLRMFDGVVRVIQNVRWVPFLRRNLLSESVFDDLGCTINTQDGYKVVSKTNNGLEFCNNEFNNFCKNEGVKRLLIVPGTPQQNGTAERMNRTLLEKARCMLISSGLGNYLWGEAVVTASYLINRSPSSVISFKTPREMWSRIKPNISHLRSFGCAAYAHVSQAKLQPRVLKCVMLGYPEGVKGYKLLVVQPGAYKCIVSRDVTFNECDFPFKRTDTVLSKSADASDENFFESLDNDDSMNEEDHSGILHNAAYDYSESETDQHDGLNGGEQAVLQNL